MSKKYKFSVSNGKNEYSEIYDKDEFEGIHEDDFYPVECSLSNLNDFNSLRHPIYGLVECLQQSDECPSWLYRVRSSFERNRIICKFEKI